MLKPLLRLLWPACILLSSCRPDHAELASLYAGCIFTFTDCFPVDPCENEEFSLRELLVIDSEGLYLETSIPYSDVLELGFSAPGIGYALPPALLAGQYRPPGSPHFIVVPIPSSHPFWSAFNAAAAAGNVLWSGKIGYPCVQRVGPALTKRFPKTTGDRSDIFSQSCS